MEKSALFESADRMAHAVKERLNGSLHSFLLYGSVVLNDFRLGWSDIDFIALTNDPITAEQTNRLLTLRQELSEKDPETPYYRCFEGVIVNRSEYLTGTFTRLVYWGTSGQRITNRCDIDPFARYELAKYGVSVLGDGDRRIFAAPTRQELIAAIRSHLDGIRRCAVHTDESLYSCGWLLDIARCMYTLRCFDIIGKTQAGEWALSERLFADDEPLRKTLRIRKEPLLYRNDPRIGEWLKTLGPTVQQYADVLEREITRINI